MHKAHEPFKALGPVEWESFAQEDTRTVLTDIFSDAHCLIDSVPVSKKIDELHNSQTNGTPKSADLTKELGKEWKEVKVNAKENPLGLDVYKLSAKDGRGAWFARRSLHEGPGFERWKTGMEREFAESLKVQGEPGDGKIRGLGADKRVVDETVDGCGNMQVYQLSARFPGPTTPRDFVSLCLSCDNTASRSTPTPSGQDNPRYFMVVSKPCVHPDCPERPGYIRGYYESVEFIREIKVPKSSDGVDHEGKEEPDTDTMVEWVMITRSDPGGSVPRFMIERGTPPGIANDAHKFWQWISSDSFEGLLVEDNEETTKSEPETTSTPGEASDVTDKTSVKADRKPSNEHRAKSISGPDEQDGEERMTGPGPGGIYGMISGALGIASAAASRLLGPPADNESESDITSSDSSDDDASSIHSSHSLDSAAAIKSSKKMAENDEPALSVSNGAGADSIYSVESTTAPSPHPDKELNKLEERKRKMEEKLRRAQERVLAKKNDDAQHDELALKKLREKHEREVAKQEEKYQRERQKLEHRRAREEKKAEERRRKQAEREAKANLALELEKTRTERDIARREIEILKEQVGQLQGLNTKLVTRLGREGINLDNDSTPDSGNSGLPPAYPGGSVSEKDVGQSLDGVKG